MNTYKLIRTPDQRLRVFVSSTLRELSDERMAVKEAITQLHLAPVMFELGSRPHPAINLYRAYMEQSHIFIGIYWQSYGYVAPGMEVSGLEDEYALAGEKPKLIYIKNPAPEREAGLNKLLKRIKTDDKVAYKYFSSAEELRQVVEDDLALLLTERFEASEALVGSAIQPEHIQHNLPAPVTSFIGREAEIAAVKELLERPHIRLITLTGPGGTGKTRLSLQVATGLLDQYTDGVIFVPLAEATEPALVISKIAEQLGVREGGSQSLLESVKSYLQNKTMLLLLDNFEQVITSAALVTELLQAAPKLQILVTSRALLKVRGEHEFQVPTLQIPNSGASGPVEQLACYEAVRMFTERIQEINPRFTPDEQNMPVMVEICRRLDGLPLAIELAAARAKMLPLEKLLSMLDSRLKLLTGGGRDYPERQQTLRKTLEWSVQLLSQKDQILFARLGVFMGGFSLESAQAVCRLESDADLDILDGIESLMNNSLVQPDYSASLQPRFRMLETIREFAHEKLDQQGELKTLQHRHAQYFNDKINEVNPILSTRQADQGLAWVDSERDNLRAALSSCLSEPALVHLAPWLVTSMNWPWYRRGFLSEGRQWANRLLKSLPKDERNQGQMLARCFALWSCGAMAMWQGDLNEALAMLEESVAISKSIEYPVAIAVPLLFLGTTEINRGNDKAGRQFLQEALELFEQLAMPWYIAITYVHMGNASLGMGDNLNAHLFLDKASAISEHIGENWLHSLILNNYGEVARAEGNYQAAQQFYEKSESLLRSMGDKGDLARLVHNLGCIARHVGDLALAEARFDESLGMFIKLSNQRGIAECLASIAGIWIERGQLLAGAKLLGAAQALLEATGAAWWPADRGEVEKNLATLQIKLGAGQLNTAWESGSKLSLNDTLAYVQEGE